MSDAGGPAILPNDCFPGSGKGLYESRHICSGTVLMFRHCTEIVLKAKFKRKCAGNMLLYLLSNIQYTIDYICITCILFWWACRDSNPEPRDYESPALTVELQALQ